MSFQHETITSWSIIAFATLGVIARPLKTPGSNLGRGGAAALVGFRLLPLENAVDGIRKGLDVYFFLLE